MIQSIQVRIYNHVYKNTPQKIILYFQTITKYNNVKNIYIIVEGILVNIFEN